MWLINLNTALIAHYSRRGYLNSPAEMGLREERKASVLHRK